MDNKWKEAAECLRTLSHPHRLQMIDLLLTGKEYSVGELAKNCNILQNVASEHLTLMKNKGFITARRQGKKTYYTIQEPALQSINQCIKKRFFNKESEE